MTDKAQGPHVAYWDETLSRAFDECGAYEAWKGLTDEQRQSIAEGCHGSHENYGMAFYSPPASDRYNEIEREWKAKYEALKREFDTYQGDAELAVRQALRQHRDANVSIGKHGEVLRHGGRTTVIQ